MQTKEEAEQDKRLSLLVELDIAGTKITDETIGHITARCKDLRVLDISECSISVQSIQVCPIPRTSGCLFYNLVYGRKVERASCIKSVSFQQPYCQPLCVNTVYRSGCHLEYGAKLAVLTKLEGLVARQCPLIGDTALVEVIEQCSSLTSLDLQVS